MIFRGNREGVAFDHGISRYEHPSMPVSIIHPLPAIPRVQNVAGVRRGTVLIIHRSNYKGPTDYRSISQESFHRYFIPVLFLLRFLCIEIHLLAWSKLLEQRWNTFKFSILLPPKRLLLLIKRFSVCESFNYRAGRKQKFRCFYSPRYLLSCNQMFMKFNSHILVSWNFYIDLSDT